MYKLASWWMRIAQMSGLWKQNEGPLTIWVCWFLVVKGNLCLPNDVVFSAWIVQPMRYVRPWNNSFLVLFTGVERLEDFIFFTEGSSWFVLGINKKKRKKKCWNQNHLSQDNPLFIFLFFAIVHKDLTHVQVTLNNLLYSLNKFLGLSVDLHQVLK